MSIRITFGLVLLGQPNRLFAVGTPRQRPSSGRSLRPMERNPARTIAWSSAMSTVVSRTHSSSSGPDSPAGTLT